MISQVGWFLDSNLLIIIEKEKQKSPSYLQRNFFFFSCFTCIQLELGKRLPNKKCPPCLWLQPKLYYPTKLNQGFLFLRFCQPVGASTAAVHRRRFRRHLNCAAATRSNSFKSADESSFLLPYPSAPRLGMPIKRPLYDRQNHPPHHLPLRRRR